MNVYIYIYTRVYICIYTHDSTSEVHQLRFMSPDILNPGWYKCKICGMAGATVGVRTHVYVL